MNPLEFINFKKDDFIINCTKDNGFNNVQANEFFAEVCEYIERCKKVRQSNRETESIINELINYTKNPIWKGYWTDVKYNIIIDWLLKAVWYDRSYYHARKRLVGHYKRTIDTLTNDDVELMSDQELYEILNSENEAMSLPNNNSMWGNEEVNTRLSDKIPNINENFYDDVKFDFSNILDNVIFSRNNEKKKIIETCLNDLCNNKHFKSAIDKDFSTIALIFYQTGWINIKTFSPWKRIFSEAYQRKISTYKKNHLKKNIEEMKKKIPFLDRLLFSN